MMTPAEFAEDSGIDPARVRELMIENQLIDETGTPLETAVDAGFMLPDGRIKRRGLTMLYIAAG